MRGQQRVGDAQRVPAPRPMAEHDRDELVVAERRDSVTQQLLSRPIVRRQVFHLTLYTEAISNQLSAFSYQRSAAATGVSAAAFARARPFIFCRR